MEQPELFDAQGNTPMQQDGWIPCHRFIGSQIPEQEMIIDGQKALSFNQEQVQLRREEKLDHERREFKVEQEEIVRNQRKVVGDMESLKQHLEKCGREGEIFRKSQAALRRLQTESKKQRESLPLLEQQLGEGKDRVKRAWQEIGKVGGELRQFEEKQVHHWDRESQEMRRREDLSLQRKHEQEAQYAGVRKELKKREKEVSRRLVLVAQRELREIRRELNLGDLQRRLCVEDTNPPSEVQGMSQWESDRQRDVLFRNSRESARRDLAAETLYKKAGSSLPGAVPPSHCRGNSSKVGCRVQGSGCVFALDGMSGPASDGRVCAQISHPYHSLLQDPQGGIFPSRKRWRSSAFGYIAA